VTEPLTKPHPFRLKTGTQHGLRGVLARPARLVQTGSQVALGVEIQSGCEPGASCFGARRRQTGEVVAHEVQTRGGGEASPCATDARRLDATGGERQDRFRQALQAALGALWLLDGLLQLQPYMFERGSNGLLGPLAQNAMGSPSNPYNIVESHLVLLFHAYQLPANLTAALVQLAIGVAILDGALARRPGLLRAGLAISLPWACVVWAFGEAFGGMIYPQASMLVGAPGAAVVYALLACVLWPRSDTRRVRLPRGRFADTGNAASSPGLLPGAWPYVLWAAVWDGTALLYVQYGNRAPDALAAIVRSGAIGEPGWLGGLARAAADLFDGRGLFAALLLAFLQLAIGQAALSPRTRRAALALGIGVSLLFWVVGQTLGGVLTGTATDPNLGPLMVLYALALWPRTGTAGAGTMAEAPLPGVSTLP